LNGPGCYVIGHQALKLQEATHALKIIDTQRATLQRGHAAGLGDADSRPVPHVHDAAVHSFTISDFGSYSRQDWAFSAGCLTPAFHGGLAGVQRACIEKCS
jgi:hypothetical protein